MKQTWISMRPVDTLLVKGASPAGAGESSFHLLVFPPPISTVSGALRTAVLKQRGCPIADYVNGKLQRPDILEQIGEPGSDAPFDVLGPLFMKGDTLYLPAPYSWFASKETLKKDGSQLVSVRKTEMLECDLIQSSAGDKIQWVRGGASDMVSLGGYWVTFQDLFSQGTEVSPKPPSFFFSVEHRTGIALDGRKVRQSHLYTFPHARLHEDVNLVYGITKDLSLDEQGSLAVGGERRQVHYKKIQLDIPLSVDSASQWMSVSVVEATEEANKAIVAAGKIQYVGGWDMKKRFHKPLKGYFPAGSIFRTKMNENCIALQEA